MGIPEVGRTIWSCNERDTSCDGVAGWTVSVCIANLNGLVKPGLEDIFWISQHFV